MSVFQISGTATSLAVRDTLYLDGYRVLLAARRYAAPHGTFPETLEALVPEFMDKIPTDPNIDAPLRYEIENGIAAVYTVGENGADEGGYDPEEPHGLGDDWCVWIRIPPQFL